MITGSCHCKAVKWKYKSKLESATACNCTACSRYGVLWGYDYLDEGIEVNGETHAYYRGSKSLGFHFCPKCGCVAYWLSTSADNTGRKRIAVNLRLADEPNKVQDLLIDHFDGLNKFEDLPRDGRCVKDMWF